MLSAILTLRQCTTRGLFWAIVGAASASVAACSFETLPAETPTGSDSGVEPSEDGGSVDAARDGQTDGAPQDARVDAASKTCFAQEVGNQSPAFGCGSSSCTPCSSHHMSILCSNNACPTGGCFAGWDNCDNDLTNGCETKLAESHEHCGACGKACAPTDVCDEGVCKTSCSVSKKTCGGDCADTSASDEHCGACDAKCAPPLGGAAFCTGSKCFKLCQAGLRECPSRNRCEPVTTASCGTDCAACPTSPANGKAICNTSPIDNRTSACDHACNPGFQKCPTGCCAGTRTITKLGASAYTSFAITSAGAAFAWGASSSGEAAVFDLRNLTAPVAAMRDADYVSISGGFRHACGLTTTGIVRCWGSNYDGQAGPGFPRAAGANPIPASVLLTGVSSVDAFGDSSCAVSSGSVYCWGDFPPSAPATETPKLVAGISGVRDIAMGDAFGCTLDATGIVRCFGSNNNGERGNKNQADFVPVATSSLFTSIAAGRTRACGLTTGKTVECWGRFLGKLNNFPVPVDGLVNVERIAAGHDHHCAVTASGEVRCWGNNPNGELGNGVTSSIESITGPISVPAVADIALGISHTCALTKAGDVYCWGANINGSLGNGSTNPSLVPIKTAAIP